MARFIVVPQWQGSRSTRAMALIDGAEAIAGDLPSGATHRVEVPFEAGESLETGVLRASTLRRVARHLAEELDGVGGAEERLVVIGGDGGVAVPAIGHAARAELAVAWFDAHAGLHVPDPATPIAYEQGALRSVLGEGPEGLALDRDAVRAGNVVLIGTRAYEDDEAEVIADRGMHLVSADASAETITDAVARTGASDVFVHIDLGVLDPSRITGVPDAQPFGMEPTTLIAAIGALRERFALVGASVVGFAPHSPAEAVEDLGTILRVIGALAKA